MLEQAALRRRLGEPARHLDQFGRLDRGDDLERLTERLVEPSPEFGTEPQEQRRARLGGEFADRRARYAYATSHGFAGEYGTSSFSISLSVPGGRP